MSFIFVILSRDLWSRDVRPEAVTLRAFVAFFSDQSVGADAYAEKEPFGKSVVSLEAAVADSE